MKGAPPGASFFFSLVFTLSFFRNSFLELCLWLTN